MTNTKFWLALIICVPILIVAGIYVLKGSPEIGILATMLTPVTLVAGGYFTSNVVASGQSSTTTTETPGKTETVSKPKDGGV